MMQLSVIIPTYNEENYLEDALQSVQFADEIIVIDSYSTDKTLEIAQKYNCKIIQRTFDNFSAQKNEAIKKAQGEWVLFLDADERISKKLAIEIKKAIENPNFSGYKFRFPHFYMNRFLYHKVDTVVRLVRNKNIYFTGTVHEKLHCEGKIGTFNNFVIHYTYKGLIHFLQKKDSYAWFQAKKSIENSKKVSFLQLFFKPMYRFFSAYILKRGFLDGIPGLAVASINAYGVFSRYAKMLLIQKNIR